LKQYFFNRKIIKLFLKYNLRIIEMHFSLEKHLVKIESQFYFLKKNLILKYFKILFNKKIKKTAFK